MTRERAPAPATRNTMPTTFMLMAQYGGRTLIPLDEVCRDFFANLTPDGLARKVGSGEIRLPIVRTDPRSQKTMRGVALTDLADYLDACRATAHDELKAITGR